MKLTLSCLALILTLLFGGYLAHGQDPLGPRPKKARTPDDYKLRTLKEIRAVGADIVKEQTEGATTLVHGDLFPSRVRVTYKRSTRPLTPEKKDVIYRWAQQYAGAPQHYTGQYTAEALFTENGADHWLVVKSEDPPWLRKNVRRGRAVDLHLIRLGAFKSRNTWQWVLLVEHFAKPK